MTDNEKRVAEIEAEVFDLECEFCGTGIPTRDVRFLLSALAEATRENERLRGSEFAVFGTIAWLRFTTQNLLPETRILIEENAKSAKSIAGYEQHPIQSDGIPKIIFNRTAKF